MNFTVLDIRVAGLDIRSRIAPDAPARLDCQALRRGFAMLAAKR
jgi:hypothetical protein